jgi:hypothetical protein
MMAYVQGIVNPSLRVFGDNSKYTMQFLGLRETDSKGEKQGVYVRMTGR